MESRPSVFERVILNVGYLTQTGCIFVIATTSRGGGRGDVIIDRSNSTTPPPPPLRKKSSFWGELTGHTAEVRDGKERFVSKAGSELLVQRDTAAVSCRGRTAVGQAGVFGRVVRPFEQIPFFLIFNFFWSWQNLLGGRVSSFGRLF